MRYKLDFHMLCLDTIVLSWYTRSTLQFLLFLPLQPQDTTQIPNLFHLLHTTVRFSSPDLILFPAFYLASKHTFTSRSIGHTLKTFMAVNFVSHPPTVMYCLSLHPYSDFINNTDIPGWAHLVEALRYKSEGRGFDSRWCHWIFLLT